MHAAVLIGDWAGVQIKATLGGEVASIVSGGAPLAPHVEEFLKVAMCAPVVQGYGLTESCAASFIAEPDTIAHAGTVGPPMPVTEFALESVPDMKYDALGAKAQGELLLKGPNLFTGYYKMPDKTVRLPSLLFGVRAGTVPGGEFDTASLRWQQMHAPEACTSATLACIKWTRVYSCVSEVARCSSRVFARFCSRKGCRMI